MASYQSDPHFLCVQSKMLHELICVWHFYLQLGYRKTKLYAVNGILLAVFFLTFRVMVHPYLYWCYSQYSGISFLKVPFNIPVICNCCCLSMMGLQLFWFCMIVKGIARYLRKGSIAKSQCNPITNGYGLANHDVVAEKNGCPAQKRNGLKINWLFMVTAMSKRMYRVFVCGLSKASVICNVLLFTSWKWSGCEWPSRLQNRIQSQHSIGLPQSIQGQICQNILSSPLRISRN